MILLGDFNGYAMEATVEEFASSSGLEYISTGHAVGLNIGDAPLPTPMTGDEAMEFLGSSEGQNSIFDSDNTQKSTFSFRGGKGELDFTFISKDYSHEVVDTGIWEINSSEPVVFSYDTSFTSIRYYSPDQFRSADHDFKQTAFNFQSCPVEGKFGECEASCDDSSSRISGRKANALRPNTKVASRKREAVERPSLTSYLRSLDSPSQRITFRVASELTRVSVAAIARPLDENTLSMDYESFCLSLEKILSKSNSDYCFSEDNNGPLKEIFGLADSDRNEVLDDIERKAAIDELTEFYLARKSFDAVDRTIAQRDTLRGSFTVEGIQRQTCGGQEFTRSCEISCDLDFSDFLIC